MTDISSTNFNQSLFFILSSLFLLSLILEALVKRRRIWAVPAILIYSTTGLWYFSELIYSPENFKAFSSSILETAYLQITAFLLFFRLLVPWIANKFIYKRKFLHKTSINSLDPTRLLFYLFNIWIVLLSLGIYRMNGNVLGALFPISSRAGVHMWARAAGSAAGASGFIVSSAAYTYLLVCSFFGVLLLLQNKAVWQIFNIGLILVSWPYFLLMGSRNQFLAVALPALLAYTLLSRHKGWIKLLILGLAFTILNYVFSIVIEYRNIGLNMFISELHQNATFVSKQKHLGLNMLEELCFINDFYNKGILTLSYGGRYIAELLNVIPRTFWPEKPLVGIDYAVLRGFGGGKQDIGVVATISTGFIGQGIMNFGPYFGPLASAFLMAVWAAFLARLWTQRYSILRLCLFLAGLGITVNLGRDITLLVLWPIIFGYILVRILENLNPKNTHSNEFQFHKYQK